MFVLVLRTAFDTFISAGRKKKTLAKFYGAWLEFPRAYYEGRENDRPFFMMHAFLA